MAYKAKSRRKQQKRRQPFEARRYNTKELHDEREYGFFWYAWLWRGVRTALVWLCALLVVVGLVSTGYEKVYDEFLAAVDPEDDTLREFTVESGTSVSGIASSLVDAGLLKTDFVFKYIVQFRGLTSSLRYGTYQLSASMSVNDVIDVLTSGSHTSEVTITVIPGWTCEDIASYLVGKGLLDTEEEFLTLCNQPENFLSYSYALSSAYESGRLDGRKYALEGYLSPDTYRVFATASAEDIIRTLLGQMNKVIDNVFYTDRTEYYEGDDGNYYEVPLYRSSLTMDETLILASIIEKEAGTTADYARVSAVFHSRLEAGMRLESDVTAAYLTSATGYILPEEVIRAENAYNTYVAGGLPVGGICNPSQAAIDAALYPDMDFISEGYLYFCAGEAGSKDLVFARTLDEHNANVARYRASWEAYDAEMRAAEEAE